MSNLPWFMDLPFQVPMQYCSLQRWTLLSPPDISTTEHRFCFGPATSLFLELLVIDFHSSSVAYWMPSDLGNSSSMSYLFAFSYCSWGSWGKNTGVVCFSPLQFYSIFTQYVARLCSILFMIYSFLFHLPVCLLSASLNSNASSMRPGTLSTFFTSHYISVPRIVPAT